MITLGQRFIASFWTRRASILPLCFDWIFKKAIKNPKNSFWMMQMEKQSKWWSIFATPATSAWLNKTSKNVWRSQPALRSICWKTNAVNFSPQNCALPIPLGFWWLRINTDMKIYGNGHSIRFVKNLKRCQQRIFRSWPIHCFSDC